MNLKKLRLVTFNIDNTQFLVNTDNNINAICIAHQYNKMMEDIDNYNFDQKDYTVERVDFALLSEIIKRDDIVFSNDNIVVFNG